MDILDAVAGAAQASDFGAWARASSLAYPVANLAHLLGLLLLVGGIGIVDLRVLGLFRGLPLAALSRALTPLAAAGLVLMLMSGATMFAADAATLATSATFRWKLALIALALSNAAAFRLRFGRLVDGPPDAPAPARLLAGLSLSLWLTIATLGRMIAYT